MATRGRFLPEFYGGPVWKEFGSAANEMMIDSDDVYLLKPLDDSHVFEKDKILRIDFYFAKAPTPEKLLGLFEAKNRRTSHWISELEENDFPALPAFQYENLLVSITPFSSEEEYEAGEINSESENQLRPLIARKESLLLYEI